jgi:G3E family GTPase
LLKRVLTEAHGQKIAVIENEFGEENIDNEILVADTTETIIQMSNGCICCNIRDDLRFTLNDLATRRRTGELDFERVLIETTGLADPGPVAQTFFMNTEIAEQYVLDAIVTLVDGKHAAEQFNQRQEARRQVGFADQIFISKSDLVGPEELLALMRRLSHMNPRAPMRRADFGRVPIEAVLDLRGFNLDAKLDIYPDYVKAGGAGDDHHHHEGGHCEDPSRHIDGLPHHHHYDDDVKSFVYRAERPFISGRAEDFLGAVVQVFGPRMLRYKGVLCIEGADRKVVFQGVHQLMGSDVGPAWAEGEPRVSKIVFIGIDLPRDILVQGLDQCLV